MRVGQQVDGCPQGPGSLHFLSLVLHPLDEGDGRGIRDVETLCQQGVSTLR